MFRKVYHQLLPTPTCWESSIFEVKLLIEVIAFFFPENKRSLLSLCGYYLNDQVVHVGWLGTLILHAIAIL